MRVLAIGAHPDDIELGCGATLVAHRRRGDEVNLLVMTTGEQGPQDARSRCAEQEDAARLLGANLYWGGFRDGAVPDGREAVAAIDAILEETGADVVYTHALSDSHQDHRSTATATAGACRRVKRLLHYETPSTLRFSPTFFVNIDGLVEAKMDLLRSHVSQVLNCRLLDLEALEALARFRGFGSRGRWAEGFEVGRFTWDLPGTPPRRESATPASTCRPDAEEVLL